MFVGSSSMQFTLAVTVAMDGTKLSFFVMFKCVPDVRVDKSLPRTISDGEIGCVQHKPWIDNRRISICYDSAYKPYVTASNSHSVLLFDDLSVIVALNCCKVWKITMHIAT